MYITISAASMCLWCLVALKIRKTTTAQWYHSRTSQKISSSDDGDIVTPTSSRAFFFFFVLIGLLTVIAAVKNRKDKLYDKTIVDYWGNRYDTDIHHWIPILISAIASVNINVPWWLSRHIHYLNNQYKVIASAYWPSFEYISWPCRFHEKCASCTHFLQ